DKSKILIHAVLENITSGIESGKMQNTMDHKLLIHPKIVKNELIIKISGTIRVPLKIELFDITGKLFKVYRMESNCLRINLSGLSSKIILLSVRNGTKRQVFKLLL
ncbi:MAG TPA: hypothetical protein VHP36_09565, partial [Chitinispirillaceae bacterium]|nr:hypothetical protein [Chitinispirillaceae bacterium]